MKLRKIWNDFKVVVLQYKVLSFIVLCIVPYVLVRVFQKEFQWRSLGKRGIIEKAIIHERTFFHNKRGDITKYHYYFWVNNVVYKNGVMFNYDAENMLLKIGDTIQIVYLPDEPDVNIDYNFLKAEGYINK